MSACLAAVIGWLWATGGFLGAFALDQICGKARPQPLPWWQQYIGEMTFHYIGLAVAVAWLIQFLNGWPRPGDTIDRLGRFVGWTWIVIGLVWASRQYFMLL